MANFFDQFHGKKEPIAREVSDSKITIMTLNGDGSFKPMVLNDMPLIRGLKGDSVKGEDGKDGKDGRGIKKTLLQGDTLYIRYDDGKTEKVGKVVGRDGINGKNGIDGKNGKDGIDGVSGEDGRGIVSASINKDGELVLLFTDNIEENLGKVRGEDGRPIIHRGGTNIGVGVMDAGSLIGTGISLIDFTGSGISSITRTDRKVTIEIAGGGGGGGAPTNATYVTLSTNATLTNERVLTAGTGLDSVDGGAGGALTLSLNAATQASLALADSALQSIPSGIDATKIADGSVTNTEFQYINTLTSNAQTQLNAKVNGTTTITVSTTAPSSPAVGDLWVDTN